MISSRKRQLEIALILACLCAPASYAEPNEPKAGLQFETAEKEPTGPGPRLTIEVSDRLMSWTSLSRRLAVRGLPKPTHVAELLVSNRTREPSFGLEYLMKTAAAQSMSLKQRQFVEDSVPFAEMEPDEAARNHHRLHLYAVSEEDAKKMIEACVELLTDTANRTRQDYLIALAGHRDEVATANEQLPEKEIELTAAKTSYDGIKRATHPFSDDTEATENVKRTILEMNNMLDVLDIELAGIHEKLKVIKDYQEWKKPTVASEPVYTKLTEMEIEQMVELRGAEARKEATLRIQKRETDFLE